jgi:hypothetical protein
MIHAVLLRSINNTHAVFNVRESGLFNSRVNVFSHTPDIIPPPGDMCLVYGVPSTHALARSEPLSSVLVCLLYQVRTYFQNR